MQDVTATFSQLFIERMKLNLLTAEPTQKQFTFYQGCVEKNKNGKIPQGKKATVQIMTFHEKCQTLMRCDSLSQTVCVMKMIFQRGTMKIIYSRIHTCTPLLRFKQDS